MRRSRRQFLIPWLVAAALAVALIVTRTGDDGKPSFDGAPSARVQRVVDGDTVRLVGLGPVRLIGVNTPEVYGHVQCFGPEASAFAKRVMRKGAEVRYRIGREAHDRYGRLLAYVYADGLRANNGRAFRLREALTLAARQRGGACYVVEVCVDCSWNHLSEAFLTRSVG